MENSIKHTYHIAGMSCSGCAVTVQDLLTKVTGVTSVKVELQEKQAVITSEQPISIKDLELALRGSHYSIADLLEDSKNKRNE
jgi:copper chaperone CopZ